MQVVKLVGWWRVLKQPALMSDPTVRSIISSMDLASLIPDLEIIMKFNLVMMDLELEVAIKHRAGCIRWHYSVANRRDRR